MMPRKFQLTPTVISLLTLCILGGAWLLPRSLTAEGVEEYARAIVEECAGEGEQDVCYESRVPALIGELSIEDTFEVVRAVRRFDPSYRYCHLLGHAIGEAVVAEDPDKWVEAIAYNPTDGLCSNGFIHGVAMGRYQNEILTDEQLANAVPDLQRACEERPGWQPTELDRAMCYHALGHLYNLATNTDMHKSISLCDQTAPDALRRVCYDGVFMQIFQPLENLLEPGDAAFSNNPNVKVINGDTYRDYCALFGDPRAQGSCLQEAWVFFRNAVTSGTGVASFCSGQPDAEQESLCYAGASALAGRTALMTASPDAAKEACARFPEGRQNLCYEFVARAIIEEDRTQGPEAIAFCKSLPAPHGDMCMNRLASISGFLFQEGSEAREHFCNALPQELQTRCL